MSNLAIMDHAGKLTTNDEAMKYVYAAYRRGVLPFEGAPESFGVHMGRWLTDILSNGGQIIALTAKTPRGDIPVGLCLIDYLDDTASPEAFWFPEASPRNRLECGLRLLIDLKMEHRVFITVPGHMKEETPEWKYLTHLGKYGVVRAVGTIRDQYGKNQHATLFQGV